MVIRGSKSPTMLRVRLLALCLLLGTVFLKESIAVKEKTADSKKKAKEKSETIKPDVIKKKVKEGGFRLPSSFENIKSKILTCMAKPAEDVPPFINGKAPFAIVQSVRGERILPEDFDRASSMVRCYTRKHGGLHFQNVFNNDYHTEMNFYSARWKTLRDRFWGTADWVIGADGDIVPIGWHKNIMKWFNNISEDVVIHIRESNYELAAAMVAFRTSSPFARCFLNEWIHLGRTKGQINSDNGDLLQLVLGVANQTLMEKCVQKRLPGNTYSTHFVPCFSQFYDLYELNKQKFLGQSYAKVTLLSPTLTLISCFFLLTMYPSFQYNAVH